MGVSPNWLVQCQAIGKDSMILEREIGFIRHYFNIKQKESVP